MTKEDFEEKLNALVPQPDPEITAALFAFGQELGQEEACDGVRELLNSMSFVSRHFSAVTTQSVYEIIQHGSAALPGEMVAAAVYLENGNTLQDVAEMADLGMLMCFHCPRDMEELSPLALCVVTEGGHSRCFHTLHFGAFDPDTALRSARQYAHDRQISVTDALLSLTTDMVLDANGGAKKILVGGDPDMTQALSAVFSRCPAAAARRTCGTRGAKYGGASTPWRACPPFMEAGRSGRPSAWSCGTTPPRRRWSCSTACWRNTTSSRAPSWCGTWERDLSVCAGAPPCAWISRAPIWIWSLSTARI